MEVEQYVLGPVTSLMVWRAIGCGALPMPDQAGRQPDVARCGARLESLLHYELIDRLSLPILDVIVGDARRVHACKRLDAIVLKGRLPIRSFASLGDGLFICCPELCFLLLARGDSLHHLIEIGCELCGTYAISPDQSGDFANCPSLTSRKKIGAYLAQTSGRHGRKHALEALRYVLDGSDSPRETSLFMLLSLPDRLGGYGIVGQVLNGKIRLHGEAAHLNRHGVLVGDEVFYDADGRAILVVEYDSDKHHITTTDEVGGKAVNVSKIIADDERREIMREQGADVITFRNQDTRTFDRFEGKARRVGKMVGQEPSESIGSLRRLREDLFDRFFGVKRWESEHELLRTMAGYQRIIRHPRSGGRS